MSKSKKVVFLRDENYMKKVFKAYPNRTYRKMIFFDHEGVEVKGVVHAFPVLEKSVKLFLTELKNDLSDNNKRLRFKRVNPQPGWRVYAMSWKLTNDFVCQKVETPPKVWKFSIDKHANRCYYIKRPAWCGCCYEHVHEVTINHQVIFSPKPIAYVRYVNVSG